LQRTQKFIQERLIPLSLDQHPLGAVLHPSCQALFPGKPEYKGPETDPLDDTGYFDAETFYGWPPVKTLI